MQFGTKHLIYIPPQLESYLKTTFVQPESRLALVRLYYERLENSNSQEALSELLKLCCDKVRDVAFAAIQAVLNWSQAGNYIAFADLFPVIGEAKFVGVRQKAMFVLKNNIDAGWRLDEAEIIALYQCLQDENAIEIIQPLYQIIGLWTDYYRYIPASIANWVFARTQRFIDERKDVYLDGAIANTTFSTLKYFINIEDASLYSQLCDCTRRLIIASNFTKSVDYVNIIALVARLGRVNQEFLTQIVRKDLVREDRAMPLINQKVVVAAIVQCQGKNSRLLDEMLHEERFSEELKNHILKEREG